jgi:hypothetical protein
VSKNQWRRTVSLPPETFVRLRRYAKAKGVSVTALADHVLTKFLDYAGQPAIEKQEAVTEIAAERGIEPGRIEQRGCNVYVGPPSRPYRQRFTPRDIEVDE